MKSLEKLIGGVDDDQVRVSLGRPHEGVVHGLAHVDEEDGLVAALEVLDHVREALGGREIRGEEVHAVDDDGRARFGVLQPGLIDHATHEVHGREDHSAIQPDRQVLSPGTVKLK